MLQNEQSKLQLLFQTAAAEQAAALEQEREQVIAGGGNFASRFRPVP
jgi:hypothetical protein